MTLFKVDLSNHDWGRGPVDIASMRGDGIDVLIHKATDGPKYFADKYFGEAMRRARAAGMPITGAYHVLWNRDVTTQIDWFIDTVLTAAPWADKEPFEWMLDCEPFGYNGATPTVATINSACERFMARLPKHRPLAYAPRWVYGSLAGLRCPVVASNYGANPASHYRAAYPGDSSGRWNAYGGVDAPVILQFGSQTQVGTQHTVDANAYKGSLNQLRELLMPGAGPAPPGPTVPPFSGRVLIYTDGRAMMHGNDVRQAQQRLHQRGWAITVDGWYGADSRRVVTAFQRDSGAHGWPLADDGELGPKTWNALWARPVS